METEVEITKKVVCPGCGLEFDLTFVELVEVEPDDEKGDPD